MQTVVFVFIPFSLCFACDDSSVGPSPWEDVVKGCAVGLGDGLCAADSGNDGCGGCKAHECGLLVKTRLSGRPSLCFRDTLVCCHDSG